MAWGCLHSDLPLKSIEADFGEGPVTVYFKDMNVRQRKLIITARERGGGQDAVMESLMIRARDSNGLRMFKDADRSRVETQFDPDEIDRVVIEMNMQDEPAGN